MKSFDPTCLTIPSTKSIKGEVHTLDFNIKPYKATPNKNRPSIPTLTCFWGGPRASLGPGIGGVLGPRLRNCCALGPVVA